MVSNMRHRAEVPSWSENQYGLNKSDENENACQSCGAVRLLRTVAAASSVLIQVGGRDDGPHLHVHCHHRR